MEGQSAASIQASRSGSSPISLSSGHPVANSHVPAVGLPSPVFSWPSTAKKTFCFFVGGRRSRKRSSMNSFVDSFPVPRVALIQTRRRLQFCGLRGAEKFSLRELRKPFRGPENLLRGPKSPLWDGVRRAAIEIDYPTTIAAVQGSVLSNNATAARHRSTLQRKD